eukprot:TRINITY_DN3945_c0_g1_i1.p1 TRINITY_DN3945_c0_g1~~TRINITY_DN3945_c0_g1_i1.p1  ORF type:complete len:192 (+),score=46.00 TRINITY_DN3945_c0_g1_i1:151-726(+)
MSEDMSTIVQHQLEVPELNILEDGDVIGARFPAKDLWLTKPVVLVLVRRPGCFLCREEAVKLASIKPALTALGVDLMGIVHEASGAMEYQKYLNEKVYLDQEKGFFQMIGNRWVGLRSALKRSPKIIRNIHRGRKSGVKGNWRGEGFLLGGLLVIGKGNSGVIYEHREKEWGNHAPLEDILEAARRAIEMP